MRAQLPSKRLVFCTLKVLLGTATAVATIMSGKGTCPPNMFCMNLGYFLPINLFTISMVLIAITSLISAFKDIFASLSRIDLLSRNIESIADRQNNDL